MEYIFSIQKPTSFISISFSMQRKIILKNKNSLYNIYILKPKAVSTNQKPYLDNAEHHNLSFRQYFPCMQLHHIWEDDIPAFVS